MQKNIISIVMTLLVITLSACGGGGGGVEVSTHTHTHEHEQSDSISNIEADVWPPQLAGIENQSLFENRSRAGDRDTIINTARNVVLKNPKIVRNIGTNYREFDTSVGDEKSDNTIEFQFYNYDTNKTIKAFFLSDGSVTMEKTSAKKYQPTEHPEEVQIAINMAKEALNAKGFDLNSLKGTAMLVYPKRSEVTNNTETFSAKRKLYVTFGEGDGELPFYNAVVNLSNNTVVKSGPIH